MKDKIKGIFGKTLFPAALITLAGLDLSLFICTLMGTDRAVIGFLPLWIFVLFTALYFVLDIVPYVNRKKWIKPVVLAAAALIIILLLVFL